MGRTMRNFRLDDEVYAAAKERARREFTTVTAVIERALSDYAAPQARSSGTGAHEAPVVAARPSGPRRAALGYSKERQARGRR